MKVICFEDSSPNQILLIAPPSMILGDWVPCQQLIDDYCTFARYCRILAQRLGIRFANARDWNIPLAYDGVHFTERRSCHSGCREHNSGHIPGAVLLPVGSIDKDSAAEVIPKKDTKVLVYCRSGNRSQTTSSTLAELGYTNIYEFGGINTWPYETE